MGPWISVRGFFFFSRTGALFLLRRAGLIAPDALFEEVSPTDCELALQITQELGHLPLALDQAGAYLEETGESLATYLQWYHQEHTRLFQNRRGLTVYLKIMLIVENQTKIPALAPNPVPMLPSNDHWVTPHICVHSASQLKLQQTAGWQQAATRFVPFEGKSAREACLSEKIAQ